MGGSSVSPEIQEKVSSGWRQSSPVFGTVWFDNRCIENIISLSKTKNMHRVMRNSAEGNQFIVVMLDKEVLFNESLNVIYYHDMEDFDLVLVNTVEETQ